MFLKNTEEWELLPVLKLKIFAYLNLQLKYKRHKRLC